MKRSYIVGIFALALLAVSLLVGYQFNATAAHGGSGCEGDKKIEGSSGHSYIAPPDSSITSVCIKAGQNVRTFYCRDDDPLGCYSLDWVSDGDDCCTAVDITRVKFDRDCKEISHTAVTFGEDGCGDPPVPPCPEPCPEPDLDEGDKTITLCEIASVGLDEYGDPQCVYKVCTDPDTGEKYAKVIGGSCKFMEKICFDDVEIFVNGYGGSLQFSEGLNFVAGDGTCSMRQFYPPGGPVFVFCW